MNNFTADFDEYDSERAPMASCINVCRSLKTLQTKDIPCFPRLVFTLPANELGEISLKLLKSS